MQSGNRFHSYPNPALGKPLLCWIGCQRFIYNAKVREDQYFRRFARKSLQHAGQYAPIDQQYAQFKSELTPWLFDVAKALAAHSKDIARTGLPGAEFDRI